jgi:hypothetical protein
MKYCLKKPNHRPVSTLPYEAQEAIAHQKLENSVASQAFPAVERFASICGVGKKEHQEQIQEELD